MGFFDERDHYWEPAEKPTHIYDQLKSNKCREIPRDCLDYVTKLDELTHESVASGFLHLLSTYRFICFIASNTPFLFFVFTTQQLAIPSPQI